MTSPIEASPWPRLARHLLKSAALVAGGIVGLNLLCLGGEYLAYGTVYDGERPKGLYVEGLPPRFEKGAELPGLLHHITITEQGFRGPAPEPPVDGDLRIFVLGGSTTFDIYAPDDEHTWPALLEEELEGLLERPVEVMNGGIPGEVLQGGLGWFGELQPELQADLLLVYHGPNDLASVAGTTGLASAGGPEMGSSNLLSDSAMGRFWRRNLLSPPEPDPRLFDRTLGTRMATESLRRTISQAAAHAAEQGIGLAWMTHPTRQATDDSEEAKWAALGITTARLQLPPDEVERGFGIWNEEVRAAARRYGSPCVEVEVWS